MEAMRREKKQLDAPDYEQFLARLSALRAFKECFAVIEEMYKAGYSPSPEAYAATLNAGRRTLRINEIRRLFGDQSYQYAHESTQENNEESASELGDEQYSYQRSMSTTNSPFFEQYKQLCEWMEKESIVPEHSFYDQLASQLCSESFGGCF